LEYRNKPLGILKGAENADLQVRKPLPESAVLCREWHIVRLAKISENAILRLMAACIVSFVDLDGIRHSVEVEAEGLYEASVLGLCAFRKHDLEPGGLTQLDVEVRSSVTHTLSVKKIQDWLQRGVRSPKEAVLKERLRAMMSA
jgi:hypothetical protein